MQITSQYGHPFNVGLRAEYFDVHYNPWNTYWLIFANGEFDIYFDYDAGAFSVKKVGVDSEYLSRRRMFRTARVPVCNVWGVDLPTDTIGPKVQFAKIDPSLYGKPIEIPW